MTKDEKIKELELEIARLKGVIEGMKLAPYQLVPRPYPVPAPYPYPTPFWYSTATTSGYVVPNSGAISCASTGIN